MMWKYVDLENRILRVEHSKSRFDGIKDPKTPTSRRPISLDPITAQALHEHQKWARYDGIDGGFVLNGVTGRKASGITCGGIRQLFNETLIAAGLVKPDGTQKFTPHGLRYFAGSLWLYRGLDLKHVSWLLGHADTKITEGIYVKQLRGDERAKEMMEQLPELFPGIRKSMSTPALPEPALPLMLEAPPIEAPVEPWEPAPMRDTDWWRLGKEARPIIQPVNIPEGTPEWVIKAVQLIDQGVPYNDVLKAVGRKPCTYVRARFAAIGISDPATRSREVRWKRIHDLYRQGLDPEAIATQMGCSKGMVCRVIKLDRGPAHSWGTGGGSRIVNRATTRTCTGCGREFERNPNGRPHSRCSECRNNAQRAYRAAQAHVCSVCGDAVDQPGRCPKCRTLTCQKCGRAFEYAGSGRSSDTCPECNPYKRTSGRRACTACGNEFDYPFIGRGRVPKRCPDCRLATDFCDLSLDCKSLILLAKSSFWLG